MPAALAPAAEKITWAGATAGAKTAAPRDRVMSKERFIFIYKAARSAQVFGLIEERRCHGRSGLAQCRPRASREDRRSNKSVTHGVVRRGGCEGVRPSGALRN